MKRTMKRYFWILAAALVSLAACDKNDLQNGKEEESDSSAVAYIRAIGGDDASKAFIDNTTAAFTWSTGDTIAVYTTDGYKISDGLASTYNGTNAATFSFSGANAVTEANRADFAFYPASLVHGSNDGIKPNSAAHHTATDLVVRLRDKYSLSEVSGDKAPTPMIATNDPNGDLSFKALCPLIRFTVRNIPKQTHSIDFKFNDHCDSNIIKAELTPEEKEKFTPVAKELNKMGLPFVGLDVIDGKIIEINVTSPCYFIREINHHHGVHLENKINEFIMSRAMRRYGDKSVSGCYCC